MSEIEDLEKRLRALEETRRGHPVRLALQLLISPALLLLIGFFLNSKLEETKQSFQLLELEVRRIEATQGFLEELFSGTPERAFIAERLIAQIVEEKLAAEISAIVKDYYSEKVEELIAGEDLEEASEIQAAAEAMRSTAGKKLIETLQEKSYYLIVASLSSEDSAIMKAQALRDEGHKSEVILSSTGYYGVTLGCYSFDEAKEAKKKAIKRGDAPKDAYIMTQRRVIKIVFPEQR
jgi:hypothetical protein